MPMGLMKPATPPAAAPSLAAAPSPVYGSPLTLGFAVFPMLVPLAIGRVGWEAGLSLVVVPLLLASVVAALCLPNRPSGLPVS